ncbi:hypothetical protein BC833DRAFT_607669 [Globomyces pollinis-pini]|nr:hypothetical protein BC833DRAFT_607669 [Globomyces pollinis-pini]
MNLISLLFIALTVALPLPKPDVQEILLAHTNAGEFKKVHSLKGLTDRELFLAAHTPNAPNPPNSLAAQQGADGTQVTGAEAKAAVAKAIKVDAAGGPGGKAGKGKLGGLLGGGLFGALRKRQETKQEQFAKLLNEDGKLNDDGKAALDRAMNMLKTMAALKPDDVELQNGLQELKDYASQQ